MVRPNEVRPSVTIVVDNIVPFCSEEQIGVSQLSSATIWVLRYMVVGFIPLIIFLLYLGGGPFHFSMGPYGF